jgi:citrate lyase subunit beta/citryl-CoA lyase
MAARFPGAMLLPLVETAKGFAALSRLAATTASIGRFVFGTIDFQVDLGIEGEGEELLAFRSELVLRSRLAEIAPPVDGVSLSIDDPDALSFESRRARRLGFGGKLCIHPRQVPVVAAVFRPSDDEVQRALRIVEAADTSRSGVVVVDGRMVDRPVVALARNTLLRASAAPSSNRLTMD